jgi:hypothetical protein
MPISVARHGPGSRVALREICDISNNFLLGFKRIQESPTMFQTRKTLLLCLMAFSSFFIGAASSEGLPVIHCIENIPYIRHVLLQTNRCIRFLHGGSMADEHGVASRNGTATAIQNSDANFTILSETLIYENWRRLVSRRVQLPSGLVANFEVVGQRRSLVVSRDRNGDNHRFSETDHHNIHDQAVLIFVWHRSTKTTTLIREYMPSVHSKMFGLAAGMVEGDKHHPSNWKHPLTGLPATNMSLQEVAARCELEEECRLRDGEWICLTAKPVVMDKYSMTGLTVFLVLDPVSVDMESERNGAGLQRDKSEEGMEILDNVTLDQLNHLVKNSELTAIGSWACLLAMHHLRIMGEI